MKIAFQTILIICSLIFTLFIHNTSFAQNNPSNVLSPPSFKKTEGKQLIFIDSMNIFYDELMDFNPEEILTISLLKNEEAIPVYGEYGKDGVLFIETKQFVYHQSMKKLSSYNKAISSIFENHKPEEIEIFINKKMTGDDMLYALAELDWVKVKEVEIVRHDELKSIYKVENKKVGIFIFIDE